MFVLQAIIGVALVVAGSSCAESKAVESEVDIQLPPANGDLDYQLGGAYPPAGDVEVLARDRTASPDPSRYNICYVNGFQTQPDEARLWLDEHPDLLLHDTNGQLVVDPEWPDEYILDISTSSNRQQLGAIVGGWIDGCVDAGFQAVEIDNLDTFTRFPDLLEQEDAVRFAQLLSERAHAGGVAIGQKNSAELVRRRDETGFDFAVVEQCNEFSDETYDECGEFVAGYGDQVYIIEYERGAFEAGCVAFPGLAIVLRDRDLAPPDASDHVRRSC